MRGRRRNIALALVLLASCSSPALSISGSADPSDVADSSLAEKVWRVYSAVRPSLNAGNLLVSTEIGRSLDGGRIWGDLGPVNSARDLGLGLTENFETPFLFRDGSGWKILVDHHLSLGGNPVPGIQWIGLRTGDPSLGWQAETKLLAGSSYNSGNSFSGGSPQFKLPSQMGDCLQLEEPTALKTGAGYWLAVDCLAGAGRRIELMEIRGGSLVYLGTLLGSQDIVDFCLEYGKVWSQLASTVAFTEANLLEVRGERFLLVSPAVQAGGIHNRGCLLFGIEGTGILRQMGKKSPWVLQYLDTGLDSGACTWSENEVEGIQVSRFDSSSGLLTIGATHSVISP